MQSTIQLPVTKCHVADPLKIEVTICNTTDTPQVLHPHHGISLSTDIGRLNDRVINAPDWPDERTPLAPDERITRSVTVNLPFLLTRGSVSPADYIIRIRHQFHWLSDDPERSNVFTDWHDVTLTLDSAGIDWIPTDGGAASLFCVYDGQVYACGSYDQNIPLPKADTLDLQAVTRSFLVSGGKIYDRGYSSTRAPKAPLLGLNGVFYRSGDEIRTNYGPGKIDDPASFEVLDAGLPSLYSDSTSEDGYHCSYARDKDSAYFFCESTSTKHALKIRACKSPETLQSLDGPFAKDAKNVYLEGRKIPKADAASFELINGLYGRDKNGIWYLDTLMDKADPDSFEILDDPGQVGFGRKETKYGSQWARDKNLTFNRGRKAREGRGYAEQCAKFGPGNEGQA